MASLAHSLKVLPGVVPPTRLRLTVSTSLNGPDPSIWSRGPIYRRLDSGFLEQPLIPKAPPTPRLRIDQVNGSLRVFDLIHSPAFSDMPETVSLPELPQREPLQLAPLPSRTKPRFWYQAAAIAAGFAAGLAAAFLFGLL
jgi:hypothetical protein